MPYGFVVTTGLSLSIEFSDQAWRERDAALLRDQMSQMQMNSMRDKLESVEIQVKSDSTHSRDE